MTLEDELKALAERRLAFKAYREQVDAEIRQLRIEKLAAEQANIEHLVVKAMVAGATLGQIKRAYGTKDHRTISDIVTARASEIEALRNAAKQEKAKTDWFSIGDEGITVTAGNDEALFTYTYVDDEIMFVTETPAWNDDFTQRNEAVALLDGKTENDSPEAAAVAGALRAL